jgi:hypothetical protein
MSAAFILELRSVVPSDLHVICQMLRQGWHTLVRVEDETID